MNKNGAQLISGSSKDISFSSTAPNPVVDTQYTWNIETDEAAFANPSYNNAQTTVDVTPPTTADSGTDTNWHNTQVTVTLTPTDGVTGSGVDKTYYTTDGTTPTTSSSQGASITLSSTGIYTIKYFSTDKVGNAETVKFAANQVKIDTVAPTTTSSLSGTAGTNGWYTSNVQVTLTASDANSGVSATKYSVNGGATWQIYSTPFTISTESGNNMISFYSVDNAGNTESTQTITVKIDKTTPVITVTGSNSATITYGDGYSDAGASVTDNLDTTVTVVPSGSVGRNVGTYTIYYDATDAAGNKATQQTRTVIVNQKTVSVSATADNKPYDGETGATAHLTVNSLVGGDAVTATGTASFADKNVGTRKTVSVTGITLGGNAANNYVLSPREATATADITAKPLAIDGITAQNKIYDRLTTATLSGTATLVGVVSGDTVILGGTPVATFADEKVETNKPVTVSGYTISGTDANNYALTQPTGLTASISKATVTPAITAESKTYDGTTTATLTSQTVNGVISPDVVSLNIDAANFDNANADTSKTVTATGLTLGGADSANYVLSSSSATTTADINKANAVIEVTPYSVTYDGNAHTAAGTATGVNDEILSGLDLSSTTHTDAGNYNTDSWKFTDVTGNYNDASGTIADNIDKAMPVITWNNPADITYGTALSETQLDATANVKGTFGYTPAKDTVLTAGSGQTLSVTFTPIDTTNYTAATASVSINVAKADQIITFGALSDKTYGDSYFAVSATASSGLAVTFGASGSCTVSNSTVHISGAGSCTITASQAGNNNYNKASDVSQTFTIAKATATVTLSNLAQTYDGTQKVVTTATSPDGLTVDLTYDSSSTAPTDAGSYVVASTINDVNYEGSTSGTLVISKATPTISVIGGKFEYDGNSHPATGSVTGVNGENIASPSLTFTYSGIISGAPVNLGTYTITASFAGNENYNSVTDNSATIEILDKTEPSITNVAQTPQYVRLDTSVTVSATVADNVGGVGLKTDGVILNYRISGGDFQTATMTANGITYNALIPTTDFADGVPVDYYITAEDNAGNVETSASNVFIVDGLAPFISSRNPGIYAVGVNPSANIIIKFSEPVKLDTLNVVLNDSTSSVSLPAAGNATDEVTVILSAPLSDNKAYTITLPGITDLAGNSLRGGETTSWTFTTATRYSIDLKSSWNLISLPVTPNNWRNTSDVLSNISDKIDSVWTYNAVTKKWSMYKLNDPSSDLNDMETGYGYWINMKGPAILTGSGTLYEQLVPSGGQMPSSLPEIQLAEGWNLIGYYQLPGTINSPIASALSKLNGAWSGNGRDLITFEKGTLQPLTPIYEMTPGTGYWIFMDKAKKYTFGS